MYHSLCSLHHLKANFHDPGDSTSDGVSALDRTDPSWSSCQYHVSLLQGEVLGDEADQGGDTEDHVLGVALLPHLPVDFTPKVDVVGVGDVVHRDEVTHGQTCVKHLGHGPWRTFLFSFILNFKKSLPIF